MVVSNFVCVYIGKNVINVYLGSIWRPEGIATEGGQNYDPLLFTSTKLFTIYTSVIIDILGPCEPHRSQGMLRRGQASGRDHDVRACI